MTDDDWEPLPADQRGLHPGEIADTPRRATAPQRLPSAAGGSVPEALQFEEPRDLVAEAAAEQALVELKARLAKAKPATSLIADVQHRELRAERKRRAAQTAASRALAGHAAAVAGLRESEPPSVPELEIDTKAADMDSRETEPWFTELPRKEQARLRLHWWQERHRNDDAGVRVRRRLGRALGYGALLFFVMSLLQLPLVGSFGIVPVLTAAGAIAAAVAEVSGGGRVRYAIAGALAFFGAMGQGVILQPLCLMSLMIATYAMATLGMDGEMRRSGGFGDQ